MLEITDTAAILDHSLYEGYLYHVVVALVEADGRVAYFKLPEGLATLPMFPHPVRITYHSSSGLTLSGLPTISPVTSPVGIAYHFS